LSRLLPRLPRRRLRGHDLPHHESGHALRRFRGDERVYAQVNITVASLLCRVFVLVAVCVDMIFLTMRVGMLFAGFVATNASTRM
jgi:hypothetical protein